MFENMEIEMFYLFFFFFFLDEVVTSHGPIEADKDAIRQEPYSLPQGFMWDTLDLSNADVVSTVLHSHTKLLIC